MAFSLKSFKKIGRILKPRVEVGGLEISDGGAVYLSVVPETRKITSASIKFPEGIIVGGRVKNYPQAVAAFKKLHGQITADKTKKIPVVASVSDANVYTQEFVLPQLKLSTLEEAVRLNLQVISPIDFSKSYHDWQRVENPQRSAHEIEILSSFSEKDIIDPLYRALLESQFVAVAVEQKAASLVRVISRLASDYDISKPHFLLYISSDGLGFAIIRNGYLYFNRFTDWSSLIHSSSGQRQVSFKEFSDTIIQESQRVINFYSSRFNDLIGSLYIIAPGMESQVRQIVESKFPLKVEPLSLKDYSLEQTWYTALGAALRGLVPRAIDTEISLAPEGTEAQFFHSQVIAFAILWRNVLVSVFTIILAAFVGAFLFLHQFSGKMVEDFGKIAGSYNVKYLNTLKDEANKFNRAVDRALVARQQQIRWSKVLTGVQAQANSDVEISRIYAQSIDSPVILYGRAASSNAAIDFKNKLAALPYLDSVDLPLSSLTSAESSGRVSFTISFKVSKANL
jgi:Tfp pilus assembly PilM family ATPase